MREMTNPNNYKQMKMKRLSVVILTAMLLGALPVKAQKQIFGGFSFESGNEWVDLAAQLPLIIYTAAESGGSMGIPLPSVPLRFNSIKQNGQKFDYDGKHVFGFKGVDLFRDLEVTGKIGWQPVRVPVGIYARFGFSHENFDSRANSNEAWMKHRINTLRPGLGLRISPFETMAGLKGFCPILEIGSTYDYHIGYSNGIDDTTDAINNGISLNVAAGLKFNNGYALMLTFDKQNYDLFNGDYVRNGVKPYENMKTNHFRISLSGTFAF